MKYKMEIEFNFDYKIRGNTEEFKEFVKDALECWGGQRHPEDWLFSSLDKVKIKKVEVRS